MGIRDASLRIRDTPLTSDRLDLLFLYQKGSDLGGAMTPQPRACQGASSFKIYDYNAQRGTSLNGHTNQWIIIGFGT